MTNTWLRVDGGSIHPTVRPLARASRRPSRAGASTRAVIVIGPAEGAKRLVEIDSEGACAADGTRASAASRGTTALTVETLA